MRNILLLALVHGLLLRKLLGALSFELAVIACVQADLLVFDVRDTGADDVQEIAIVRDDQQDTREAAQPALQPENGRQVEVIGGLIQQQHIRATHQGACQVEAHAPATRERGHRVLNILGRKPESVQEACGASVGTVAIDVLHVLVQRCQGIVSAIGFCCCDFAPQRNQFSISFDNKFDSRNGSRWAFLLDMRDNQVLRQAECTIVGIELAHDHCEQGSFAAAVGANHAQALARMYLQTGIPDEQLRAPA